MNTSRMIVRLRRHLGREDGVGLMMVIGIGLLLMAMGVLSFSIYSIGETSSNRHLSYEQAIHVAENGVDTALAELQAVEGDTDTTDGTGYNTDAAWEVSATTGAEGQLPAGTDSVEEETAWLVARAAYAKTNFAALKAAGVAGTSGEGDFALLSPSNRQTVYSIGWVPDINNPVHTRFIKTEWLFSTWQPDHALLVDGPLDLSGATIAGLTGNVHANDNIELQANSTDVSGLLSTSGTISATGAWPNAGIPNYEQGSAQQDVPNFDPRLIWERQTASAANRAAWYDLCPDGTVRTVASGQDAPCEGAVHPDFADGVDFRGWGFGGDTWSYSADDESNGVYYIYQANGQVSGNPGLGGSAWQATIIAEAEQDPSGEGACAPSRNNGDIKVTGTPNVIPFLTGLGYIAGRDLKINGNPSSGTGDYSGFFAAGEQVEVGGNVSINGSIVVQDLCDTPSSTINDNNVHGSVEITYDGNLDVLVGATIRSVLWLEL